MRRVELRGGARARHRAAAAPGRACCRHRPATWPSWCYPWAVSSARAACGGLGARRTTTRPVWACCWSRSAGTHAVAARRVDRKDAALGAAERRGRPGRYGGHHAATAAQGRRSMTRCRSTGSTVGGGRAGDVRDERAVGRRGARRRAPTRGRRDRARSSAWCASQDHGAAVDGLDYSAHPTRRRRAAAVCAGGRRPARRRSRSRPCTGSATSRSATWPSSSAVSARAPGEAVRPRART